MSVVNRSRRRQKNADWNAAGTIQEVLNKPVVPVTGGTVGKILRLISPNNAGDSSIEETLNQIILSKSLANLISLDSGWAAVFQNEHATGNGLFVKGGNTNYPTLRIQDANNNKRYEIIGTRHLINGAADDGFSAFRVNGIMTSDYLNANGIGVTYAQIIATSPYLKISTANYGFSLKKIADDQNLHLTQADAGNDVIGTWNRSGDYEAVRNLKAANFRSGIYTPTVTYTHTPAPSIVPDWHYHIVGDWVHVFGDVMITPQGGVSHVITFTLPVPSAFVGGEASGTIIAGAMLGFGSVYALPSGVVAAQVNNQLSINQRYVVNFKYKIV